MFTVKMPPPPIYRPILEGKNKNFQGQIPLKVAAQIPCSLSDIRIVNMKPDKRSFMKQSQYGLFFHADGVQEYSNPKNLMSSAFCELVDAHLL